MYRPQIVNPDLSTKMVTEATKMQNQDLPTTP